MNWLLRYSRFIFLILAILLALPVPFSFLGGLQWFSPYLLLNTVLVSKTFVLFNLIGLAVLILIPFKRRFICRYICPLGVVCDQVSKIASKKRKLRILKNFNKPLALFTIAFAVFGLPVFAVLDPFYIFQISFEAVRTGLNVVSALKLLPLLSIITINLFFPNSWCINLCPLGGLQVWAADLKQSVSRKRVISSGKSRRLFISSLAGLSIGMLTPSLLKKSQAASQIRPPSALPDNDYFLTCIRCGNCISACPTNILYQQEDVNLLAFLSPAVDFSESYCLPDCKICGDVCPSGALSKFTLEKKKHMAMATVSVDQKKCLLYQQKECQQCQQFCDYNAISYQLQDFYLTPVVVIDNNKCVGCAACKIVCPENAIHLET
jgi:ferredoxin-type protein NapF